MGVSLFFVADLRAEHEKKFEQSQLVVPNFWNVIQHFGTSNFPVLLFAFPVTKTSIFVPGLKANNANNFPL